MVGTICSISHQQDQSQSLYSTRVPTFRRLTIPASCRAVRCLVAFCRLVPSRAARSWTLAPPRFRISIRRIRLGSATTCNQAARDSVTSAGSGACSLATRRFVGSLVPLFNCRGWCEFIVPNEGSNGESAHPSVEQWQPKAIPPPKNGGGIDIPLFAIWPRLGGATGRILLACLAAAYLRVSTVPAKITFGLPVPIRSALRRQSRATVAAISPLLAAPGSSASAIDHRQSPGRTV